MDCGNGAALQIRKVLIMSKSTLLRVITRKGTSFCAVRGYESKGTGEIANHLIQTGYSYENANKHDLAILKAADAATVAAQIGEDTGMVADAIAALIKSVEKPDPVLSESQKNAYTHVGAGLKVHNETGQLYVTGLTVRKQVLIAGEYKVVNSKPATIVKNKVSKALNLRKGKIRQYIFDRGTFNLRGVTLTV